MYLNSTASVSSPLAGVPHAAINDDVYEGFFIPKGEVFLNECAPYQHTHIFTGAVVIGNSWWAFISYSGYNVIIA